MKLPAIPALDAASFIACAAALLYLFGLANLQGDASALQLPFSLLHRDVRDMIALGAESLLASIVLLPVIIFSDGQMQWPVVLVIGSAVVVALILYASFRRKQWFLYVLGIWVVASIYLYMFVSSATLTAALLARVNVCLAKKAPCDSTVPITRIVYSTLPDKVEERLGSLLMASQEYFIVYTTTGILVVPRSGVRSIESGRP